ncbi:MAG TPA: hypothetical protein VM582_09440, partial [Candidatus Thermoplasmatota archaeon]|nr:hypothetical protein [Candidatus Thermoplasmatota archaeon]
MMPYWVRISLGVVLGLASAAALWLLVGVAWITALVAALLAAIGFLGSYFIWSADRLDEGYEQVLFDRPNTIVTLLLIAGFALAGTGTAFIDLSDPPPTPEQRLKALYARYQSAADAHTSRTAEAATTLEKLAELRVESDRVHLEVEALPESPKRAALEKANDALALAIDAMQACVAGEREQCIEARILASDVTLALERLSAPERAAEDAPEP